MAVNRLGQIKAAGDADALFLEVFSGEVLVAFDTKQTTADKQLVRTIQNGKSAQFPGTWKASAAYFTPGDTLAGSAIEHGERVITIEEVLLAQVLVPEIDELHNHYDVRGIYTHQLGEALANAYDLNTYVYLAMAGQTTHMIYDTDDSFDGEIIWDADAKTVAADLKGMLYDAAQCLDEKDIPADPRYCSLKPAQFFLCLEDGEFIHRDYAGEGSKARAKLEWASGLQLVKSNNIPMADLAGIGTVPTAVALDMSANVGSVWHPSAVGTVKLMALKTEQEWAIERQATWMVAKYAMGQGVLRAESSISLRTAAADFA